MSWSPKKLGFFVLTSCSPWLSGLTLYTQAVISAPDDPVPYVPSPPATLVLQ